MFRGSVTALRSCSSVAAAVASSSSSSSVTAAASSLVAGRSPAEHSTWFNRRREGGVESAVNMQFLHISLRPVEVKSCDLTATMQESGLLDERQQPEQTQQQQQDRDSSTLSSETSPDRESFSRMVLDRNNNTVIAFPISQKNKGISEFEAVPEQKEKSVLAPLNSVECFEEASQHQQQQRFGDGSGSESLTATQPLRPNSRQKGQWGKAGTAGFGKIWHQPRNFPYVTSKAWNKKFYMKKHRYTKRWRKRRYKVAALANLPFAKKLRVNMIPRLQQGNKKTKGAGDSASGALADFSIDAQDLAVSAVQGKTKSGVKPRYRPKSKYQI